MIRRSFLAAALTLVVFTVGWTATRSLTPNADTERAQLPVLKVFSAKDGEAVFRAYLVKWKDQEVIVRDTLVKTNYREGDTAVVLVMRHSHPNDKAGHDLLNFEVVPPMP